MKPQILALILLAAPAMAEDKPNLDPAARATPGAVATYLSALTLYDQGVTAKDPLMVLTAARMMRGLSPATASRQPQDTEKWTPPDLVPVDAQKMFEIARQIDVGGSFSDLIEIMSRETPPPPRSLRTTPALLAPGAADTWSLQFYGGTYAELGILGGQTGNIDLAVTDASGNPICTDNGASDTAYCGFVPLDNGDFTVTVTNSGKTPDGYSLLTN